MVHRWVHSYGSNPASGPSGMVAFSKVLNIYKDYSRPKSSAWIFPLYFHLPAWRYLFSASGIFYGGRYQPGSTGIFSPVEGTSQPVTISKKWKNSALLYIGKGPEYRPFHDFWPVPLAYRARAQISNHRRASTQAPSPIHNQCLH
jgi:hypothetical protein